MAGPKRSEQVLRIRQSALAKLEEDGEFRQVEGFGPVKGWRDSEWSVLYRTPFQRVPAGVVDLNFPYGLDIWHQGSKVLNIEWEADEAPTVVSMKRGDWEERFLRSFG